MKELKTALSALGQSPSDEELFVMISQVRSAKKKKKGWQGSLHANYTCHDTIQNNARLAAACHTIPSTAQLR